MLITHCNNIICSQLGIGTLDLEPVSHLPKSSCRDEYVRKMRILESLPHFVATRRHLKLFLLDSCPSGEINILIRGMHSIHSKVSENERKCSPYLEIQFSVIIRFVDPSPWTLSCTVYSQFIYNFLAH